MSVLVVEREGDDQVVAFFQMHMDGGEVRVDAGNTRRTAIDVAESGEELHTVLLAQQGELVDFAHVEFDVQRGDGENVGKVRLFRGFYAQLGSQGLKELRKLVEFVAGLIQTYRCAIILGFILRVRSDRIN